MEDVVSYFKLPVLVLLVNLVFIANAAVISIDGDFGSDTLTYDTSSGLQWLDLGFTQNQSYLQVNAQLALGGQFHGYRYATIGEVTTLFDNAGINGVFIDVEPGDPEFDALEDFLFMIDVLGTSFDNFGNVDGRNSFALTSTIQPDILPNVDGVRRSQLHLAYPNLRCCTHGAFAYPNERAVGKDHIDLNQGSWLVRIEPVPIPAGIWLFVSGLIGLIGVARFK